MTAQLTSSRHEIDADFRRKTDEFLATNPSLSRKLDDLDKLLLGNYLQTQLQQERNGWRSTLAKAMEELERHRKLSMQRSSENGSGPVDANVQEQYKLRRQFTDFMDEEESEPELELGVPPEVKPEAPEDVPDVAFLRHQLVEANERAVAASELAGHYENFIRELKAINGKLEARLTQLAHERRRCARLLNGSSAASGDVSGGVDLYKAIRELQNRCEQHSREQQQQQQQQNPAAASRAPVYCSACGSAMSSSSPMSDGDTAAPGDLQQQQQQPNYRDQIVTGAVLGWKKSRRMLAASKPSDIAIVPLRPRQQLQVQKQQQQQQQQPAEESTQTDPPEAEPLAEIQLENARLRRDVQALAKALRTAEDDAKEKTNRLAAYEKQVASMKHAFTYRQPLATFAADVSANPIKSSSESQQVTQPAATPANSSLPVLNLAKNSQKRSMQQQQQQQQQQPVMPAKTSVTRCLRCQKLYRLVDNNKFACKFHAKGKQRLEQHSSQGRLADVLFVWDCCGKLANAEGCCYSEHI